MSTAVGLLPPGRASELVAGSVQKLRGLVEDVLEVARLDSQVAAVETEEREVSAMARRAVAGLEGVQVTVAADAVVATDPRRVERILANLAADALRHGAPPVEVEVDGPVVRVRGHGPGFPADLLAVLHTSGPQRFRTGSRTGGTGLGLTIATARPVCSAPPDLPQPSGGRGDGAAAAGGLIRRRRGAPFGWAESRQSAGVAPLVGGVDVCG